MAASTEMIPREERRTAVPILKHQAWSGAELMDQQMSLASGGSATTAAMGSGVTEEQFTPEEEVGKVPLSVEEAVYRRGNSMSGAM
jgi:isocitrate lyase